MLHPSGKENIKNQECGGKLLEKTYKMLGINSTEFFEELSKNLDREYETVRKYTNRLPQKYFLSEFGLLKASIIKMVDLFSKESSVPMKTDSQSVRLRYEKYGEMLLQSWQELHENAVSNSIAAIQEELE